MPIIVREFTWKQTPTAVNITIPLSSAKKEKVDLFATDSYIKAHYSPFLFEVFLRHEVAAARSCCRVLDDRLELHLCKREPRDWDQLEKALTKPEKMQLRQQALEKCQEKAKEESEQKRIRKSQMDRFTVQKAMEIDSRHHELMDSRRDEQRKIAMDALEEWRVNADTGNPNGVKIVELPDDKESDAKIVDTPDDKKASSKARSAKVDPNQKRPESAEEVKTAQTIPTLAKSRPRKPVKTPVRSEYVEQKRREAARRVLPAPRAGVAGGAGGEAGAGGGGTLQLRVRHTPRAFPTPSRESARAEEEAWLKNITHARRATGFVSEDLRPEEQDPQWCKNKGDEFFRAGNFLGAVSAYSHGIQLSDRLPSLFANRAATHFALGNFNKCVNDCSSALDLLQPACERNRRSRAACVARRAAALARLGRLSKAIDEMKAAARLLPEDGSLRADVCRMERAWEQNPDSD